MPSPLGHALAGVAAGWAVAGPVADRLGVQIWYIVGGGVCMGMGILAFFVPSILNMEDHRAPEAGDVIIRGSSTAKRAG